MNISILKTNSDNVDFIYLIKLLDEDLKEKYGDLQKQYDDYNRNKDIKQVLVIYRDNVPVGCGAYKEYKDKTVELKRIFIDKKERGNGLGKLVVNTLEKCAKEKYYKYAILETGIKQNEAIHLYKRCGYTIISNYGQYIGNTNSICMKKTL
ncbi:GNAT family N-acetyltransferase [Clostridium felsineum]|uniref:GNAT family N-acetyltransferase n=1 Tax=Clostridium felsineum TaxID=36839 RepID=UPI00214D4477|nr:GNAT family N-acetyltransferase [Clostridium felsineum]MCR3761918.1 GNAT family N-acetyltransferase [Clostridium felsineum]